MGYSKIKLHGKQICDYFYIQQTDIDANAFSSVDSEPKKWTNDTLLFANFNDGNLIAGNSELVGSINSYELRRRNITELYTDRIGTIETNPENTESRTFMVDYLAANNASYIYYLYPDSQSSISGAILSPFITEEVKTNWNYWTLIVVDESEEENIYYLDKMYKFELNLNVGDMSNNTVVNVVNNFTPYPTIQYGTSNYWSGSLSSLCGFITCNNSEYIQTINMIQELKDLPINPKKKFLKDIDGHVWEVKITAPVVLTTENNTIQQVKTAQISWAEVASAKGVSVINNPSKSVKEWVFTETGYAIPYIDYSWSDNDIWNNSLMWTSH